MEIINALGRRKNAIARVFIKDGNGKITVNKKDYKESALLFSKVDRS